MSVPAVFRNRRGDGSALVDDMSFLTREPAGAYHAMANCFLSSHQLADFH